MTEEQQTDQNPSLHEVHRAAGVHEVHPSRGPRPSIAPRSEGDGSSKKKRLVAAAATVVLLIVVGLALWFALGRPADIFDPNAKSGQAPNKSAEEMQAELDRIVEEGMFGISIASVIEFDDGAAPGTAYLENVPGNRYLMQVAITLDDTGETVYESKAIKPGSYIESITLSADLDAGTYPATAMFTALDAESHDDVGKAAAKVTLIVKG